MMDIEAKLTTLLSGRRLTAVTRREFDWAFAFDTPGSGLGVASLWRIVSKSGIALTSKDDGQKFGLPEPVDGEREATRLLVGKVVQFISVRPDTGDIAIHFSDGTTLEALNTSVGYESWKIGIDSLRVIGVGGGQLAIFG